MTSGPEPLLGFRVAGRRHAVPLAGIQEILRLPQLQPAATAGAAVAGVLDLRGQAVPVLDLGWRLGFPPRAPAPDDLLVVLREGPLALWVEAVEDVLEDAGPLAPPAAPAPPWLRGLVAAGDGRLFHLLDPGRLEPAPGPAPAPPAPDPALRRLLEDRARACRPARETPRNGLRTVLGLLLNGERYALDLAEIREIAGLPPLQPLPGAPPAYPGLVAHRGELLLVLDPRPLLGLALEPRAPGERLLVVEEAGGRLGIRVEAVLDVFHLGPGDRLEPNPARAAPDWLEGDYRVAGAPLALLRLPALLAQPVPVP